MRIWKNNSKDDGSIHCLGNGNLCVYAQGPNLIQVFGSPYNSPAFYRLTVDGNLEVHSERQAGTATWSHHLLSEGHAVGEMVYFVDAELPCLVRHLQTTIPLHFRVDLVPPITITDNSCRLADAGGGLLLEIPPGRYFYHHYPYPQPVYHQLAWQGPVRAAQHTGQDYFDLLCEPGECLLFFIGGKDYAQVIMNSEAALSTPYEVLGERTRKFWQAFTARRSDFNALLPQSLPRREQLLKTVDDVAVLIKTQQTAEGAVLSGHNYHMGYIRDQYGIARGLLTMGYVSEARRILEFYWKIWQQYGRLHNGQATSLDGIFHVHENDEVEITGYLVRQAFDLLAASGDEDFIRTILPMLIWAWQAQKKHLVDSMLPFNGDETYIAGSIIPRSTLYDGSAEATLLFIDGGEKLLQWAAQRRILSTDSLSNEREVLATVRSRYRQNFWQDGQLITNNPVRAARTSQPRFRHGVCEKCQVEERYRGILWTERNPSGRYLCPECLASDPFPAAEPHTYILQSVSLIPFYLYSNLFTPAELAPLVEEIITRYQRTGWLPSSPGETAPGGEDISVGYDYGFLLFALTKLDQPMAGELYDKTLSLVDSTGAWVEYYRDHHPEGTRCRPWESAINLEALLYYAANAIPKGV
jgi:hypothetical protein